MPDIDPEVKKQMDELVELNKQLLARVEKAEEVNKQLQTDLDDLLKAEDGADCKMEDGSAGSMKFGKCVAKVDKALIPESVQKALDASAATIKKQAEDIQKLRDKEENREWVSKAAAYSDLPIKADELGPILKSAATTMSVEEFKVLDRVLKAGSEACKELLKVKGSGATDTEDTAYNKLMGLAKQFKEKSATPITIEKAFTKVSEANPELMAQHRAEARASH